MSHVGFEPSIPVFDRGKRVYTLDIAPTVISTFYFSIAKKKATNSGALVRQ
jgi:hypothetical protein